MVYYYLTNEPSAQVSSKIMKCIQVGVVHLKRVNNHYPFKNKFDLRRCGSPVVRHLPLVLEVPGSIPASREENLGVQTCFL